MKILFAKVINFLTSHGVDVAFLLRPGGQNTVEQYFSPDARAKLLHLTPQGLLKPLKLVSQFHDGLHLHFAWSDCIGAQPLGAMDVGGQTRFVWLVTNEALYDASGLDLADYTPAPYADKILILRPA